MYDEFDDEEEWIEEEEDEASSLLICPSCRAEVHEDTQQCPRCGDWITPVYPRGRWGWVWKIAALLVILSLLLIAIF